MKRVCVAALTGFGLILAPAQAAIVKNGFDAVLSTGPLAVTPFTGTFSYDNNGETGVGKEYFTLASLHFVLKGVAFDKSDIRQGGQVILDNGAYETFTAAFFPPPPFHSPTADIAFGFGGPGIIGYLVGPDFGSGTFVATPFEGVPEPGTVALFAFGLLALAAAGKSRSIGRPVHPR